MNRDQTVINQAPTVTKDVNFNSPTTKTFNEGIFSITLPGGWKYLGKDKSTTYHPYQWQGTGQNDSARTLAVYIDNIPTTMAVNRLLPLATQGSSLVPGTVSDNCTNFTGDGTATGPSKNVTAKWGGVNFICDMENYERNVVGTGSSQAINIVTLAGPSSGAHKLFFTYTDNSAQPDYTIFADALTSFKLQ